MNLRRTFMHSAGSGTTTTSIQYNSGPWPHIRGNNAYTGQSPYTAQSPNQILFLYNVTSMFYILSL